EDKFYDIVELKSYGMNYQKLEDGIILENGDYSIIKNESSLKILKNGVEYADLYQPYNLIQSNLNERQPYYLDTSDGSSQPSIRVIKTSANTIRILYIDGNLKSPYFTPTVLSVADWNKYMKILKKEGRNEIEDLKTTYKKVNKYSLNIDEEYHMSYIENWDETDYYLTRTLNSRQKMLVNNALAQRGFLYLLKRMQVTLSESIKKKKIIFITGK
ncbi:MAG: hypothetical protein K0S55_794, partial [Clostridia bacterium]|nr:hypothetical protein [Clostridia bacterium]